MQKAILQAVATPGGQPARAASLSAAAAAVPVEVPLAVITESLGSKVAFDALFKLSTAPDTSVPAANTWNRVTQIFMGANQLPIPSLADQHTWTEPSRRLPPIAKVSGFATAAPTRDGRVWVLFGDGDLRGWLAVDGGAPPASVLPLVRPFI